MTQDTRLEIPSSRGPVAARFSATEVSPPRGSVLTVGGYTGGFAGPGPGLYGDLAVALPQRGIAVLRLDFRIKKAPGPLADGTSDAVAGIDWLAAEGQTPIVLVGHSYGGAIVVRAAHRRAAVAAVATLATQTAGLEAVEELAPRPLLVVHGTGDRTLPHRLSEGVYRRAREPKRLELFAGASHSLTEARGKLFALLADWVEEALMATTRG